MCGGTQNGTHARKTYRGTSRIVVGYFTCVYMRGASFQMGKIKKHLYIESEGPKAKQPTVCVSRFSFKSFTIKATVS